MVNARSPRRAQAADDMARKMSISLDAEDRARGRHVTPAVQSSWTEVTPRRTWDVQDGILRAGTIEAGAIAKIADPTGHFVCSARPIENDRSRDRDARYGANMIEPDWPDPRRLGFAGAYRLSNQGRHDGRPDGPIRRST